MVNVIASYSDELSSRPTYVQEEMKLQEKEAEEVAALKLNLTLIPSSEFVKVTNLNCPRPHLTVN